MNLNRLSTVITVLTVAAVDVSSAVKPAAAVGLTGLTRDNTLVNFDSASPNATSFVQVTGIDGSLIGIDFRSNDGLLYGLSNSNKIYTINSSSGATSLVSTLSTPFLGGAISGVDFNPAADRLRVVGSNDQNFRINVDSGATTVDGTIAYAAGDANTANPNITAAAYTNSFLGGPSPTGVTPPTRTTALYGIDSSLDVLVQQIPPNDGTLTTIGSLGIDFSPTGGFDIFTDAGGNNIGYAASDSVLYSIDLANGTATSLGDIGGSRSFIGLAAAPTAVPEPSSVAGSLALVGFVAALRNRRRLKHN